MQLTFYEKILIKALYLIGAAIIVLQLVGLNDLVSNFFTMTFVFTGLLWAFTVTRGLTADDLFAWGIIFVAFVHVFINAWATDTSLSFSYLRKVVMFATSVLFLTTVSKLRVDRGTTRFLFWSNTGLALVLIAFFLFRRRAMYELNGIPTRYLTFRFINPNLAALFLTCIAFLLIAQVQQARVRWHRWLSFVLAVVMVVFIVLTESRSALVAALGYFLLIGWMILRKKSFRPLSKWLLALIAVFPLLFAFWYMAVINMDWLHSVFGFMVREGKALTNRKEIWQRALNAFMQSPIVGAYSQMSNRTGTSQMHNTHLDIMTSYGVSVLAAVCVWLYRLMKKKNFGSLGAPQTIYMVGFIGTLLLGNGEAALFSGGLGIYLFIGSFLLLSNPLEETADEAGIRQ